MLYKADKHKEQITTSFKSRVKTRSNSSHIYTLDKLLFGLFFRTKVAWSEDLHLIIFCLNFLRHHRDSVSLVWRTKKWSKTIWSYGDFTKFKTFILRSKNKFKAPLSWRKMGKL